MQLSSPDDGPAAAKLQELQLGDEQSLTTVRISLYTLLGYSFFHELVRLVLPTDILVWPFASGQSFLSLLQSISYSNHAKHLLGENWTLRDDLSKAAVLSYGAGCARWRRLPLPGDFWREFIAHIEGKIGRGDCSPTLEVAYWNYRVSARIGLKQATKRLCETLTELSADGAWWSCLESAGVVVNGDLKVSFREDSELEVLMRKYAPEHVWRDPFETEETQQS